MQEQMSTRIIKKTCLSLVKAASIYVCSAEHKKDLGFKTGAILYIPWQKEDPSLSSLPVEFPVCFIHRLLVSLSSCSDLQANVCPLFTQALQANMWWKASTHGLFGWAMVRPCSDTLHYVQLWLLPSIVLCMFRLQSGLTGLEILTT